MIVSRINTFVEETVDALFSSYKVSDAMRRSEAMDMFWTEEAAFILRQIYNNLRAKE